VLSEFSRRGDPDSRVKGWLASVAPQSLFVSVLTLAEIRRGIELLPAGKRREQLEVWLESELIPSFLISIILPVTKPGDRWAAMSARAQERGIQIAVMDGLIAATVLEHGLTLATRNIKDFSGLSVAVFNPWDY